MKDHKEVGKMVSILVACANGAGTSLMMKMTLKKVLKKLDIKLGNFFTARFRKKERSYEVRRGFRPLNFISMFKSAEDAERLVIGLRNVMSVQEMEEKLLASGVLEKKGMK